MIARARTTQFDDAEMSADGSGYGATVDTFVTTSTPLDHTTVQTKLEDERSVTSSLVPHSFDSLLSVAFPEATLESTWICATLPPRWFQAASPSAIETISVSARTASESAAQMRSASRFMGAP